MKEVGEEDISNWNAEELKFMSGWDTAKINGWVRERPCEEVRWVRPSITRIF